MNVGDDGDAGLRSSSGLGDTVTLSTDAEKHHAVDDVEGRPGAEGRVSIVVVDDEEDGSGNEGDGDAYQYGSNGDVHDDGTAVTAETEANRLAEALQRAEIVHGPLKERPPREMPASYRSNNTREAEVLKVVDNFCRQFKKLYKQRKPVQAVFKNECGIEKFVSTTVRPSLAPFEKLRTAEGIAEFIADFIAYDQLAEPTELPTILESPATTLYQQHGNALNMSNLLVSLLEGAGYDAYVVNGYATREVTTKSPKRRDKRISTQAKEEKEKTPPKKKNKYAISREAKLASVYDAEMQKREDDAVKARAEAERAEREAERERRLQPEEDDLSGLRVHAWVLLLPGKRGITEACFIEPTTGHMLFVDDPNYVGIESVWNSKNFWVNMQRCEHGLRDVLFDLSDTSHWEYILPLDEGDMVPKADVPTSWVEPLEITNEAFELRCPQGKRRIQLLSQAVEVFAEYINKDGMVRRVTVFEDEQLDDIVRIEHFFKHRMDKLEGYVMTNPTNNDPLTSHRFSYGPGHPSHLKEHTYTQNDDGAVVTRAFTFYSDARIDGLVERVHEGDRTVRESYSGRKDRLLLREATFTLSEEPIRKVGFSGVREEVRPPPTIDFLQEKYGRDPLIPAHKAMAEIIYFPDDIQITFHRGESDVTAATLELEKPQVTEKQEVRPIRKDNALHYTPKTKEKGLENFQLFDQLHKCLAKERAGHKSVQLSLKETEKILDQIQRDSEDVELHISFYDTMRNEKSRIARAQKEQTAREEAERQARQAEDYLAPYLVKLDDATNIDSVTAAWLKDQVMNDVTRGLKKRYQYIEEECAREAKSLETKTLWFKQNQASLSAEEEKAFAKFRNEALFRLNILQKRLSQHKERTPRICMEMEHKLRSDPRLSALLT